ncbi:MAG: UbiA family prenyltransferase [Chitinophagales bacterium]
MAFFSNIQNRLWANVQYKFSTIFCSLYVVLFLGHASGNKILWYIFISILLSMGIAGMGYVLNDYHDYHDDIKNGKQNLFINFSKGASVLLVICFLFLSVFPWFILPFDQFSLLFISLEFILFFIYALPPFRLKERGLPGVVTDALYAQVVPCILAVYTYSKIVNHISMDTSFLVVYVVWLILMGIRNILNHQIEDYDNDLNTQTQTFVTDHGILKTKKWVMHLVVPVEWLLFFLLLFLLPETRHLLLYAYILYVLAYIVKERISKHAPLLSDFNVRYDFINKQLLNEFYEIHFPLLLLCYFSFYQPFFIWILSLNLLMFFPIYLKYTIGFIKKYFHF